MIFLELCPSEPPHARDPQREPTRADGMPFESEGYSPRARLLVRFEQLTVAPLWERVMRTKSNVTARAIIGTGAVECHSGSNYVIGIVGIWGAENKCLMLLSAEVAEIFII
jgi:hypothetical protein